MGKFIAFLIMVLFVIVQTLIIGLPALFVGIVALLCCIPHLFSRNDRKE